MAGGLARAATLVALSLFCRHNRYTSDCPICSKGTVLDTARASAPRRSAGRGTRKPKAAAAGAPAYRGPYASAGPYFDDGTEYEVRLERVPGGLRLASWTAGSINRRAPVLAATDLAALLAEAAEKGVLADDAERLLGAVRAVDGGHEEGLTGASPGRAGELREELRIEALGDGRLRVGRWILRPNHGWELQESPVMLPAARYAEALGASASG